MKNRVFVALATAATLVGASPVAAQDDTANIPPEIYIENWQVFRAPLRTSAFREFELAPADVPAFLHQERDCVVVTVLVIDADWRLGPQDEDIGACCLADDTCTTTTRANCATQAGVFQGKDTSCLLLTCPGTPIEEDPENREAVFLRADALPYPFELRFDAEETPCDAFTDVYLAGDVFGNINLLGSPAPPSLVTIPQLDSGIFCFPLTQIGQFFGASETEGFAPMEDDMVENGLSLRFAFVFEIPEFTGKNQNRLRELINFDIAYEFDFAASNTETPSTDEFDVLCAVADVKVIESPELAPPNSKAFADAGVDRIVASGRTIVLDASRTFDSFNVGFNPDNDNVIEKDRLKFEWEWISGPTRVDPVQESEFSPTATVTIDVPDAEQPYVYQVSVTDQVNPGVTVDTVAITVLDPSELRPNRSPRATVTGDLNVTVGDLVVLSGLDSTDPDGDALRFRWSQVNELGLPIAATELQEEFQPLSGLTQPEVTWQANKAGTYYVRLVIDDGELSSAVTTTVRVSRGVNDPTPAAGDDAAGRGSDNADADGDSTPTPVGGLCGAGIASAGLVPLALLAAKSRRRR